MIAPPCITFPVVVRFGAHSSRPRTHSRSASSSSIPSSTANGIRSRISAALGEEGSGAIEPMLPRSRPAGQNEPMSAEGLRAAEEKMRCAGQPDEAVRAFRRNYERVEAGESGYLRSEDLEPVSDVATLAESDEVDPGEALAQVVAIKLHGGLATTMGLRHPKSLVQAREGHTFLDIIIGQVLALRDRHQVRLPLVLMNSEATRSETLQALRRHPELDVGLPLEFMQSMVPKLERDTLDPVSC